MNISGLISRCLVVVGLVLVAGTAAACGGGSSGPQVASIARSGSAPAAQASRHPDALGYSRCMRSHGVANFPDPSNNGSYDLRSIDRDSPQFQAAATACQALRPPGLGQTVISDQAQLLKFSACMRSHGEPKFPDIGADSTRRSVRAAIKALDPSSTTFQNALSACRSLLPANLSQLGSP